MTVVDGPDFLDDRRLVVGSRVRVVRADGSARRGRPAADPPARRARRRSSRSPRLMHLTSVGTVAHVSAPRNKSDLADATRSSVLAFFLARKEVLVEVAVEFELTPGDLQALMSLDPDEPKPMKVLAETFRCDPSNATWMVDRLEQRGIVERQSLPTIAGCARRGGHDRRPPPPRQCHGRTVDGAAGVRSALHHRTGHPPMHRRETHRRRFQRARLITGIALAAVITAGVAGCGDEPATATRRSP